MKIDISETDGTLIANLDPDYKINTLDEALDLMMNSIYQGADRIILRKEQLHSDFFELNTGLAGEILQKFSTYGARLAIVGDFTRISSKSLKAFIHESNKVGRIHFVDSIERAMQVLNG